MRDLILASTSSARRALMDGLGLPYRTQSPGVDETVAPHLSAKEAVRELAARKARAVHARNPDAWVLGADQLVEVAGETLTKPDNRDAARGQLGKLLGHTHDIHTGVCLVGPGGHVSEAVETARLTFHAVTPDELERYLDLNEWEGCCGSYRVEGAGQALLARLDGDRSNVQGLPMVTVVRLLRQAGFPFFERR
ncbi:MULTISPECIES: nucleoside triphosphate pyrophosphatase [Myxococcus]|uniref:Nucleoside triphosphate pyrophosphatase n=1 Tax=Myxococcus llanfairpwllgwyngyllgogerychwyrndrobwllllantysiliogogogochensis TaxID=2590453 RepID=A0A540WKX9_9BACT|nr:MULTISPECIES: Maf family protein [Myxococcus]NTX07147.1 septum formation protein Maf [Myxococcus sp. CA040A]TQF09672.1 septum formation protein Maf [Myxococcus llanfairpwllgwyngyllgogerychwyrndrobwllllantysiliogogogochensis]